MTGQSRPFPTLPELADAHFRHWKSVFEHLTGVQLSLEREGFVRSVLQKRVLEKGASCFENYLHQLLSSPAFGRIEWEVLFDRIVIGETRFFRHAPTFRFLNRYFRDRLCTGYAKECHLKVWSLGCSTGEEAYSLAMTLHRICRGGQQATFEVTGTDINRTSLETARRGVYRDIEARGVDEDCAQLFFEKSGNGVMRIRQFLKDRVRFLSHNMLEPVTSALFQNLDVIHCQNVLVYLQRWRRRAVVRQLTPTLKPGGVLVVGEGELSGWKPEGLERMTDVGVHAYRRIQQ